MICSNTVVGVTLTIGAQRSDEDVDLSDVYNFFVSFIRNKILCPEINGFIMLL